MSMKNPDRLVSGRSTITHTKPKASPESFSISRRIALGLLLAVGAASAVVTSETEASSAELFYEFPGAPKKNINPLDKARNECKTSGTIRVINKVPTCVPSEKKTPAMPSPRHVPVRPKTDDELLFPLREYENKYVGVEKV